MDEVADVSLSDQPFPLASSTGENYQRRSSSNGSLPFHMTEAEQKLLIDSIIDEKALTAGFFLDYFEKALKKYNEVLKMIGPLLSALNDKDPLVRCNAAQALSRVGNVEVVEHLILALGDENHRVRQQAAQSLGELGASQAVEPLLQALKDDSHLVRCEAIRALGKVGNVEVVKPLIKVLEDKNHLVRRCAARSLGELATFLKTGKRDSLIDIKDNLDEVSFDSAKSFDSYIQSLIRGMTADNYYHLPVGGELL